MDQENDIKRIFECVDKINEKLDILTENDTRNTVTLEEHVRRTDLLETMTNDTKCRVDALTIEIAKNKAIQSTIYRCACIGGTCLATIFTFVIAYMRYK